MVPVKLVVAKLPSKVVAVIAPETHTSVAVANPTVVTPDTFNCLANKVCHCLSAWPKL